MMQKRVAVFMELCTQDMSNTNYTEASIRTMVKERQDADIIEFCYEQTIHADTDKELADLIRDEAINI